MPGRKVRGLWMVPVDGLRQWLNGEAADAGRGLDIQTPRRWPLGGDDQPWSAGTPPNSDPILPNTSRSAARPRRAKGKRRPAQRAHADGWQLPRAVGT